ncbi:polysaccharide deacetylase family protein [Nocardioides zeicaulis]|uniref:Polysaccharide deacetylase family protein n=1 Tax=Nocardioides zeicaulis TaxID=1776857 RepID=A0ABV6DVX8_9ACTN
MALTVDDGPNGSDTRAVLDLLGEHGVRATFCLVGSRVRAPGGADLVRRIAREGHGLGNHAWSYADLGTWSSARVRESLVATTAAIGEALGDPRPPVPWFRAPNGSWGRSAGVARELGMRPLDVGATIGDWLTQDVGGLVTALRRAVRPGGIVTVHDGGGDRSGTVAALAEVVPELLAGGWRFTPPPADG